MAKRKSYKGREGGRDGRMVSRELKRNAVRGEKCVWLKDGGQEER